MPFINIHWLENKYVYFPSVSETAWPYIRTPKRKNSAINLFIIVTILYPNGKGSTSI